MGNLTMTDITQALLDKFGEEIVTTTDNFRGQLTVNIQAASIVEVCSYLQGDLNFKILADIAGVDYIKHPDSYDFPGRFGLAYQLLDVTNVRRLTLKVYWDDGDDPVPSVSGVWKSAIWEEREAYDMFGIQFSGNPDLRRLLMPDDWQGYPQRRDYPLGYETVQFSFNYDEVNKHKPFAKE